MGYSPRCLQGVGRIVRLPVGKQVEGTFLLFKTEPQLLTVVASPLFVIATTLTSGSAERLPFLQGTENVGSLDAGCGGVWAFTKLDEVHVNERAPLLSAEGDLLADEALRLKLWPEICLKSL